MTDTDLNRRVAIALGHTVREYRAAGDWQIVEVSEPEGVEVLRPVPDYAHDLNAALGLVETLEVPFVLSRLTAWKKWEASFKVSLGYDEIHIADNPATAICEAWLACMQEGAGDDLTEGQLSVAPFPHR